MSVSKGAIIALTLIGGGTVGAGIALTMDEVGEPYFHFLFEDNNYNKQAEGTDKIDYTGKYGETYGRYLIGISASGLKKDTKSNDRWWKWSFNNRYTPNKSKAKDKFSEVTDETSLKTKCAEAYKASSGENGDIKANISENEGQNKFLESNIWLFCSPAEEKIKSISDENKESQEYSANDIYGDATTTKKDLVSVLSESKGNTWFWNFQKDKYSYINGKIELQIANGDVKEWCKQAYKKSAVDSNFSKENVLQWCSLSWTPPIEVEEDIDEDEVNE